MQSTYLRLYALLLSPMLLRYVIFAFLISLYLLTKLPILNMSAGLNLLLFLFTVDGELEIAELLRNIDVVNYHCYYGKELMREFKRIDKDNDGIIRYRPHLVSHDT